MRFITLAEITAQTLVILPRFAGQVLRLGATEVVTEAETPARVYGTGMVEISEGYWDDCTIVAGEYAGPPFNGSSPMQGGGLVFPATAPFTFDSGPAVRNGSVLVAGDVATWPVFEIYGPVTNPEVEVVGVGRLVFNTTLAYDQFLRVDTRPWARWVQRGYVQNPTVLSPLPGALSPSGSRLSDMALRPGAYQVLLRGYDPSGTAELGVVLNPAYTSF